MTTGCKILDLATEAKMTLPTVFFVEFAEPALFQTSPAQAPGRAFFADRLLFQQDAFAKIHKIAKQKFRPKRRSGFSGVKAYT
ncbi:MAG: hypothetical protein BA871_14205 [Desulfuromonadales bacterium C00003096]|jgi:hypothetical protein|nr:MAG: hypothetical protein BA871_14205 [Desulfuromonadales bacterium C00003096]